MHADISLVFRALPDEGSVDTAVPSLAGYVTELVRVPGVLAARAFSVNVVLGERTPAFYPELVMYESDGAVHDAQAAMLALGISGPAGGLARPDGLRFAAWGGTSVGARSDFELPDHLYLQFSAQPASLSFDAYSDWYQVHQDENIAQSEVLRRGWRYRLEPVEPAAAPGPTHLALYQLDGTLETLTSDLGRAMAAGVISLPDWFTRFASLEAIAVGDRVTE
jgi:hypothetical protein